MIFIPIIKAPSNPGRSYSILTSGGHLRARAARVANKSGKKVVMAICGGRSVDAQQTRMFKISSEDIEDFER